MNLDWQSVSLILGILVIIVGALIKIFGNNNKNIMPELKLPKEFYNVKTQVGEQQVRFEEYEKLINEKLSGLSEDIKELKENIKDRNEKIDKLTEIIIKYISKN